MRGEADIRFLRFNRFRLGRGDHCPAAHGTVIGLIRRASKRVTRQHYESEGEGTVLAARILELARLLVVPGAIPEKAGPDAVHIAASAVEECEFLLTWNFRHIANVRIRREVERILSNHGCTKTTTCSPEELIGAETGGR
jgi:hypothetical protein